MYEQYKIDFHIKVKDFFEDQSQKDSKRVRALLPQEKKDIIRVKSILDEDEQLKERNALALNTRLKYDSCVLETKTSNEKTLKRACKAEHKVYASTEDVAETIIGKHEETAHGSTHAVTKIIQRGYYGIPEHLIKDFIGSCPTCLVRQKLKTKPYERSRAIHSAEYNERTQWDLVDMRSVSDPEYEFKYFLNRVDHTSGFSAAVAIKAKTESEVMMQVGRMMCRYGIGCIFQTDNGSEFINFSRSLLSEALDFKAVSGRARHPQSQGSVERNNGFLCSTLGKLMEMGNTKDWEKLLDLACAITNNRHSRVIKTSPFKFVFGVDLFRSDSVTNIHGLVDVLLSKPRGEQRARREDEYSIEEFINSLENESGNNAASEGSRNEFSENDDSETEYNPTSDLLNDHFPNSELLTNPSQEQEQALSLSHKRKIRDDAISHREVYAKKRTVDPKNKIAAGTTVRVSFGNNPTTPVDAKSFLAVVTGNNQSGYQLGTLQGKLKGSFSAVQPLPNTAPKALQIPVEKVPKKSVSISAIIKKHSMGHPGKANICCKCKTGCTRKSCKCLKNDRACSSHCKCDGCMNTNAGAFLNLTREVSPAVEPPPAHRVPDCLLDDVSACALGNECIMFQRTGSMYGASHHCMICEKSIHNLCNFGRINSEFVLQFPEYEVESDEICSVDCFGQWLIQNDYPLEYDD